MRVHRHRRRRRRSSNGNHPLGPVARGNGAPTRPSIIGLLEMYRCVSASSTKPALVHSRALSHRAFPLTDEAFRFLLFLLLLLLKVFCSAAAFSLAPKPTLSVPSPLLLVYAANIQKTYSIYDVSLAASFRLPSLCTLSFRYVVLITFFKIYGVEDACFSSTFFFLSPHSF